MSDLTSVKQAISKQWQDMLASGRIPCFEIELNNGDWLVADIHYFDDNWLYFEFDENGLKTWFDGGIKKWKGSYRIKLDECYESLDHYLQEIYSNIIEGYVIPNTLLKWED